MEPIKDGGAASTFSIATAPAHSSAVLDTALASGVVAPAAPHLVVFSGGTAFNGIAGYLRPLFPNGVLAPSPRP